MELYIYYEKICKINYYIYYLLHRFKITWQRMKLSIRLTSVLTIPDCLRPGGY
jgi:hypothetical protein